MMTAQKEDKRPQPVAAMPALGALGTVQNTLQGLQKRLDGFTIDDVSQANENLSTLLLRLSEMLTQVGNLAAIKHTITASQAAVSEESSESFDPTILQRGDKPLPLHSIVQARNLIQFRRVMKTARDNAKNISLSVLAKEPKTSESNPETPIAFLAQARSKNDPVEKLNHQTSKPQAIIPIAAANGSDGEPTQSSEFTRGESEDERTRQAESSITLAAPLESPEKSPASKPPEAVLERNGDGLDSQALVPVNANFDHRLLDDLIKNYGEFTTSPNLPATLEPVEESPAHFNNIKKTGETHGRASENSKRNVPSLKKDGELDRKLKKLIKDYGEYDLYSQQSPINFKTGVIAAFLLLGVVFSGFYFLSSRGEVGSPPASPVTQSTFGTPHDTIQTPIMVDDNNAKTFAPRPTTQENPNQLKPLSHEAVPDKNLSQQ